MTHIPKRVENEAKTVGAQVRHENGQYYISVEGSTGVWTFACRTGDEAICYMQGIRAGISQYKRLIVSLNDAFEELSNMNDSQIERCIKNYKRDIRRFQKVRKICVKNSAEWLKYNQAINNLKAAVSVFERKII